MNTFDSQTQRLEVVKDLSQISLPTRDLLLGHPGVELASTFCFSTPIKGVVFDFDGTIANTWQAHTVPWKLALEQMYQVTIPSELWSDIFLKVRGQAEIYAAEHFIELTSKLLGTQTNFNPLELLETRNHVLRDVIGQLDVSVVDNIPALLEKIKTADIRIALCSTSSNEFIAPLLHHLDLTDYFDIFTTGDELSPERTKPLPDPYLLTIKRLGLPPDEVIAFEDSITGCLSAVRANITTCLHYPTVAIDEFCYGFNEILLPELSPGNGKKVVIVPTWHAIELDKANPHSL